nr:unnamed protein product [Callosobruchus chinensis]
MKLHVTLIDVICTSNLDRVVSCNVKSVDAMSDHELISCSLDLKKDTTPMTHTFRNYRNLDINALTSELNPYLGKIYMMQQILIIK